MLRPNTGDFAYDVYDIVRQIPPGRVMTYRQIAMLLGFPSHARLVGHALKLMPPTINIPAHRVVNAQGRPAPCWLDRLHLYADEGILLKPSGLIDMKKFQWHPEDMANLGF